MNDQMQVLLEFLKKSECMPNDERNNKQIQIINNVIKHAKASVPLYQSLYANVQAENIHTLPILTRNIIQANEHGFLSQNIPEAHGVCYPLETSGSTGIAVKVLGTDFTRLFYDALMLREHAWHNRDLTKKLMAIRWNKPNFALAPLGHKQLTWGPPINKYKGTGESIFINVASDTRSQIDALLMYEPDYIFSYPSQLAALAEFCLSHKINLSFLKEVRTTGEMFNEKYKAIIAKAWNNVKITDIYSTEEVGIVAQQCPEYHQYHVNSESVYLEVVDEDNVACKMGQSGKVLITSLLNYATPLIRYDIGDYAELGEPCQCGRTLPVIKKILGRKRNRLMLPNGETLFPYLGEREDSYKITKAIRKFQYVQHTLHDVEIKLVVSEPLTFEQEEQYKKLRQKNLGYPFNITLTYHDHIPLGPTGKYEEFISLIS